LFGAQSSSMIIPNSRLPKQISRGADPSLAVISMGVGPTTSSAIGLNVTQAKSNAPRRPVDVSQMPLGLDDGRGYSRDRNIGKANRPHN